MIRERAVELTPDQGECSMYLNNLGSALLKRFEWTGSMDDLDRAITANKRAVESTRPDVNYTMYLSSLANALVRRAERIGSMDDLDAQRWLIEPSTVRFDLFDSVRSSRTRNSCSVDRVEQRSCSVRCSISNT